MLVPSEAQLPKDRRIDAGQINKTDVYYRNPNPASTSRGKWKEGFSPAPSSLCFQPKMPPSCIIMPRLPHSFSHSSQFSTIPSLAPRTFTALIYHFMQQSTFGVFSKAEERDSCYLVSSPKLKGSSYRRSEMLQS